MKSPLVRGDATREALISSATELFSAQGFSSVSTRELAERSGINQALIGYHFGNKEGLYLAVFEHIRDRVRERVGPMAEAARALLYIAAGVTTVRDMGNDNIFLPELMRKIANGSVAGPDIIANGFLEGRSDYSARNGIVASTEAEVVAIFYLPVCEKACFCQICVTE